MSKITNKLGTIWLNERVAQIKALVGKAKNDRASQPKNLIAALAVILRIIRLARAEDREQLRKSLRQAILKHYRKKKLRKPRKGTNPLVPIVKLCIPGDGPERDKDRHRYTGYLTYCVMHNYKSDTLFEKFKKGTIGPKSGDSKPGPRVNRYSINRLSKKGHQEWKESSQAIGISIDWSKLDRD